jgi:hypothetical protein
MAGLFHSCWLMASWRKADQNPTVIPAKIRYLAVLGGCASAIFGPAAFGAPFLVLGAIIQPRAHTSGRWLIWVGALLLSIVVVPMGPEVVLDQAKMLRAGSNPGIFSLFVVATISTYLCDIALVFEAVKRPDKRWFRGRLDCIVWIAAAVLTAWCVWQSYFTGRTYQQLGGLRIDLILTTVGFDALILLFDVALIILATRGSDESLMGSATLT